MTYEEIEQQLNEAQARDPRTAPFGVFTRDPYPAGVGMFFWYETRADLERALLDHHPFIEREPDIEEHRARWAPARRRMQDVLASDPGLSVDGAAAAGAVTEDEYCLEWWGTFDDLCARDDEWATDVRESFRQSADDGEFDGTPIKPDELEAFIETVQNYGY